MKAICVEVTKVIVTTVEAEDYEAACKLIQEMFDGGEYQRSWKEAEPQFKCLEVSEAL